MFYRLKDPKLSKLGQKRPSFWAVWSPDEKYIAYGVQAEGKVNIVRKPSSGSSAEETLPTQGPEIATSPVVDWSSDVRYLSYDRFNINQGRSENWILPLLGEGKPFQCAPVVGGSQYDGNFSPDGHWLAYFSDGTGQPEVYVSFLFRGRVENTRFTGCPVNSGSERMFSGAPDSSILRLTPTIIPWSMEATSCGSVATGSRELFNIRTIASLNRIPICCTIFAPSTSELSE
jgi:hypothetical protein